MLAVDAGAAPGLPAVHPVRGTLLFFAPQTFGRAIAGGGFGVNGGRGGGGGWTHGGAFTSAFSIFPGIIT